MDNILEVKNVTYEYTDEEKTFAAVKNLSLNIERGSFTVILGHNGSGKSTLAKMLNGLNKPTSGDVFADGINTKDEETEIEVKRKVGMVFQNPDNQFVGVVSVGYHNRKRRQQSDKQDNHNRQRGQNGNQNADCQQNFLK